MQEWTFEDIHQLDEMSEKELNQSVKELADHTKEMDSGTPTPQ